MSFPLVAFIADVLLPLMIPVLIIATRRRAGGAIVACAAAALICFGMLGFVAVSNYSGIVREGDPWPVPPTVLYSGGSLGAFAGWTLALYDAVSRRRGRWLAALTLTSVASWTALSLSFDPCSISELLGHGPECGPLPLFVIAAGLVVALAGPAVSLAYGLRVYRQAQLAHISPSSSLDAALEGEHAEDADAELEMHAEPL